jgi:hypothetical protein
MEMICLDDSDEWRLIRANQHDGQQVRHKAAWWQVRSVDTDALRDRRSLLFLCGDVEL